MVIEIASRISGASGPGVTDFISLQHWILCSGEASIEIRLIVVEFAEWLAIEWPLWAAYCLLVDGRLIGQEKCRAVQPVEVGDT